MINQFILNSIISGSLYTIVALSFSIIYSTTKFFNLSHAIILTSGAYFTFLFYDIFSIPFLPSILLSIFFTALFGGLIDFSIYRPLRKKKASSLILLLASMGLYIVFQNLISIFFGDTAKVLRFNEIQKSINILNAWITHLQIYIIFISIIISFTLAFWFKKSKLGKVLRAAGNNSELIKLLGINKDKLILLSFILGSVLASIAGILIALDVDMTPTMGLDVLFMGVVAMIVGGSGSIYGIACASLLIGFARNFGVLFISSQWQSAIVFIILLIFLLFRPQGFFGKPLKKAEI